MRPIRINARPLGLLAAVAFGAFGLVGCESKQEANLAKAQACLDQATPATVDSCTALVGDDASQKAMLVRCAGLYIKNGFVGDRVAQAFERIKENPSGGTDPMLTGLSLMAFTDMAGADLASQYCTASGVRSMERLSTFTSMATLLAVNGIGGTIPAEGLSEADMTTAIANVKATLQGGGPAAETLGTQLGTIATQAEQAYCQEGSSFTTSEVCQNLSAAVQAGDVSAVAIELLNQLQSN